MPVRNGRCACWDSDNCHGSVVETWGRRISSGRDSPQYASHGNNGPWSERLRERECAHHITKVTLVAIGATAGNERIAARYSEDGDAEERLDSRGELAQYVWSGAKILYSA